MPEIRDPHKTAWEEETPGWLPPLPNPDDPNLKPARTTGTDSYELADVPIAGVTRVGLEPGASEFSWGKGLMPPTSLVPPSQVEQLHAVMRTNPADSSAQVDYSDRIRE